MIRDLSGSSALRHGIRIESQLSSKAAGPRFGFTVFTEDHDGRLPVYLRLRLRLRSVLLADKCLQQSQTHLSSFKEAPVQRVGQGEKSLERPKTASSSARGFNFQ